MTDEEIRHTFIEIATGPGRHGSFLMAFANAVLAADPSNFALVRPLALLLISKCGLDEYLDNFQESG